MISVDKGDFYKILCSYTPEELNEFISSKGKLKTVNAVTFITDEEILKNEKESIESKLEDALKQYL